MTAHRYWTALAWVRRRAPISFAAISAAAVTWSSFVLQPILAQEQTGVASQRKSAPTEFRRIFVPAENVEAWPRNGEKLLPIEAREFDAWVAAANRVEEGRSPTVTIVEAEYSARLDDTGRALVGRGRWRIDLLGRKPSLLSIDADSAVISDAHWQGSPQRPVRIGAWGADSKAAAEFGLEVTQSGTLDFAWSTPAHQTHHGVEIPWGLPPANATRILLELTDGRVPSIDGGVVVSSKWVPENGAPGKELRQWELICNTAQRATLRIADDRPAAIDSATSPSLSEEISYQVTPRGLDMVATWTLTQTAAELPDQLALSVPRELQIVSVIAEGQELRWRPTDAVKNEQVRVVIACPGLSQQRVVRVTVRASSPLVLSKPWRLPRLRPEGLFWTSGEVKLEVTDEIELRGLTPIGCVETGSSQLAGVAENAETWQMVSYLPTSSVEIEIAKRQSESTLRLGSSLAIADPDITGRLVTRWAVAQGKLHHLSGEMARGWVVETVETVPADALGEWFIDEAAGRPLIDIQLSSAASASRAVSVIITGRLPRSEIANEISVDALRMVKWRDASVGQHLVAFETSEPLDVEAIGNVPMIEFASLDGESQSLVDTNSSVGAVFDLSSSGSGDGLKLSERSGEFAADVRVEASIVGQEIKQEHRIVIKPTSNRVDRVLIAATSTLGEDVLWSEAARGETILAERLSSDDSRRGGLPPASELWLIRLPRPSVVPVEIVATTSGRWTSPSQLPLLAVLDAIEQQGRAFVRADVTLSPVLKPFGMTAVPRPPAAADSVELLPNRAAYRFEPLDCLESTRTPQLQIAVSSEPNLSTIVARRVVLDSYFSSGGEGSHRATYFLTNEGGAPFEWKLPTNATLSSIEIDGRAVSQSAGNASAAPQSPLAVPKGRTIVAISFDTQHAPLSIGSRLAPPLVESNVPLLTGEWNVRLPEEFSLSTSGSLSWRQRLFGPLGRPNDARPFHPLRASDWASAFRSMTGVRAVDDAPTEPLAGWRTHHTSFIAGGPAELQIARPAATNAWTACVFLLSLVGGVRLGSRRHRARLVLVAVAACLAFLLPAFMSPLAAGAVWGFLLSTIVPHSPQRGADIGASTHWHRYSTVGASVLVAIGCFANLAFGQPGDAGTSAAGSPPPTAIHRVLIPVTADGLREGSKYYVSDQFAEELLRAAEGNAPTDRQWLLRNVAYHGELREGAEPAGRVAGELTMTCEVEVLARDTTIVLPVVRGEATWPTSALLDGVPRPIQWHENGRECAIKIAEPGQYTLLISLVPRTAIVHGQNVVKLSIPTFPGAMLRLDRLPGLAGLNVLGATSRQAKSNSGDGEWELNTSGQLEFRWPVSDVAQSASGRRITQLEWLQITESGVELTAKYIFEGRNNQPEDVVVSCDTDWNLVQNEGSAIKADVESVSSDREKLRIRLPSTDDVRNELVLHWRLSTGRSLGRLLLPPVELVSHPVIQRWRGVSAAASIECEVLDRRGTSGTAPEFVAMWGAGSEVESPQIVLGNVEANQPWVVSTKPRETVSEIYDVLHLAAGGGELRLVYEADIVPGSVHRHQLPLIVPAAMSIDEITATESDRAIPLRWSKVVADRANVFFGEELTKQFKLTLRASMPAGDGRMALPTVGVAGTDRGVTVQLYRGDDVALRVDGLPEPDELRAAPLQSPPKAWTDRHVAGYRLDNAAVAKVRLQIEPNRIELAGDSITTLAGNREGWFASHEVDAAVAGGTLDSLRLHVPLGWGEASKFESSPSASVAVAEQDAEGTTLSLRFAEAVAAGNRVKVRIESPLKFATGSVSVPHVRTTPAVEGHEYICVPRQLEGQPVVWRVAGAKEAQLPPSFRDNTDVLAGAQVFESVSTNFHIAMLPQISAPGAARVRLADISVSLDPRGRQLMTTRFAVEPNGLTECSLQLPENQQLVAVHFAGLPALAQRAAGDEWRVTLGSPQLPSIVEVISRSRDGANDPRRSKIRRPTLLSEGDRIPVEINLWSVSSASTMPGPAITSAAEATVGEQTAMQFDQMLRIAESATPVAIQLPSPDGYNWYQPWRALLTQLRSEAVESLAEPDSQRAPSQISRPAEEQLAASSARLDAWIEQCAKSLGRSVGDDGTSDVVPTERPEGSSLQEGSWMYCVTDGALDSLQIVAATDEIDSNQTPIIGVLAITGVLIAAVILIRRPESLDLLYQWPHAVGFLIGLACWAWLQPSWCGLVVAAGCAALALHSGWPGRAIRLDGSTVLRASRPR